MTEQLGNLGRQVDLYCDDIEPTAKFGLQITPGRRTSLGTTSTGACATACSPIRPGTSWRWSESAGDR